jgi:hypothetical protein
MPQRIEHKEGDKIIEISHKVLIKNASSYPIYLNFYTLNGVKSEVGSSIIPVSSENWFGVPIPKEVEKNTKLYLSVNFEDYIGNKYLAECYGTYTGEWGISSSKRTEIYKIT